MYCSPLSISLCFLTLRFPHMFTGVKFYSQNVLQVEQPWEISGGGVTTASNIMFVLQ